MAEQDVESQRNAKYSTLEPRSDGQWQAAERLHLMPQIDYSGSSLEVDPSSHAPELVHWPFLTNEAAHSKYDGMIPIAEMEVGDGAQSPDIARKHKSPTICGIRRRIFWTATAILVTLAAIAIGVGIGVGVASRSSEATTGRPDDSADPSAIASDSKLATTNITDQYGNDNFFVFYQVNSGAIKMGSFNRSGDGWTVTALSDHLNVDPEEIAPGTSMSASGAYRSSKSFELNLCWTSTALQLICYLWQSVSSIPADLPGSWTRIVFPTEYDTVSGSAVATYSQSCSFCDAAPFIFWQDPTAEAAIQGVYKDGAEWRTIHNLESVAGSVRARHGTPLFLMPVGINDALMSRNMYYFTESGIPTTLTNFPSSKSPSTWHSASMNTSGLSMSRPISIAAFSTTRQNAALADPDPDDEYQLVDATVLVAGVEDGRSANSVRLLYFADQAWHTLSDPVADLAECVEYSVITANQAGRVYCIARKVGADGVERMQILGFLNEGTGMGRFTSVGNILSS